MAEMQNTTRHKTLATEGAGYRHSDNNYLHSNTMGIGFEDKCITN